MTKTNYAVIGAWNELVSTLFGEEGKYYIERLIECMSLGLLDWLPRWTILVGGPRTGKSTILFIITCILLDTASFVSGNEQWDVGQYNSELGCIEDADINRTYKRIQENWKLSTNYHIFATTNNGQSIDIKDDHVIIHATGETLSQERFIELKNLIYSKISELRLYFKAKANTDLIERRL